MAARTRDQLRTLVRTQLDVDDTELPDLTIDGWLEDGFERTLAVEDHWPFFEAEWTFSSVADQRTYAKTSLSNSSSYVVDQIISIYDVTTPGGEFEVLPISHDRAKALWGVGGVSGSVPAYWSDWAQSINLWPIPTSGLNYRVDGYRKPSWAAGDAVAPDCDARLHLCLFHFAVAMAYAQQEDEVLSQQYLTHWQAALKQAHAKIMSPPQHRPIILSRGVRDFLA